MEKWLNRVLYKMERDKLKRIIFKCADLDKDVLEKMENEKEKSPKISLGI